MKRFLSYTIEELKDIFVNLGEKPFRAKQSFEWVYQKNVLFFDEMTSFSNDLRDKLKKEFVMPGLSLKKHEMSKDKQTVKFLWKLRDDLLIESVLILAPNRATICVSSQVGCKAKCSFCASGKCGFFRDLETSEIIEQVLLVNKFVKKNYNINITNIVFMGMGEPLLNYDNVVKSIKILSSQEGLNISKRKISISTVGILEGIKKLSSENMPINLVLSLHAPNEALRQRLMPYTKKYKFADLLNAIDEYFQKTKRDVTFEYILIKDVNDNLDCATQLADLLYNKQIKLNLIPYNPVDGILFQRSENAKIKEFKDCLASMKINLTQRYTKGSDISAACGQLVLKNI
jgi:23S rRNA (adenine2503-C2)-methyltransferase